MDSCFGPIRPHQHDIANTMARGLPLVSLYIFLCGNPRTILLAMLPMAANLVAYLIFHYFFLKKRPSVVTTDAPVRTLWLQRAMFTISTFIYVEETDLLFKLCYSFSQIPSLKTT